MSYADDDELDDSELDYAYDDDEPDPGPYYYDTPLDDSDGDDPDIYDPDDDYDDDLDAWDDIIYDDSWLDRPYQWQHRY